MNVESESYIYFSISHYSLISIATGTLFIYLFHFLVNSYVEKLLMTYFLMMKEYVHVSLTKSVNVNIVDNVHLFRCCLKNTKYFFFKFNQLEYNNTDCVYDLKLQNLLTLSSYII